MRDRFVSEFLFPVPLVIRHGFFQIALVEPWVSYRIGVRDRNTVFCSFEVSLRPWSAVAVQGTRAKRACYREFLARLQGALAPFTVHYLVTIWQVDGAYRWFCHRYNSWCEVAPIYSPAEFRQLVLPDDDAGLFFDETGTPILEESVHDFAAMFHEDLRNDYESALTEWVKLAVSSLVMFIEDDGWSPVTEWRW